FIEDFNSDNGQRLRRAEFGRQWIETPDRRWVELTHARFTHTGKDARTDYATGAIKRRFYLQCGGYRTGNAHYGDMVARPASGRLPAIEISSLLAQALPSGK
ncbi:MAG TPA: DUF3472 domain-containing protein, partial [Chthonomonadales bacterium]|nr:DUF3472 domain-containing protein [Chthonomonadales bacterium]